MGNLNPEDAAFELQRWHPELHISPELASWLLGCSGEELLLSAHGAVPIERLSKIMQHARHPERGPGDLSARVLHGLAVGANRIQIRGSDHIPMGTRELVLGARASGSVFEGPSANRPDLRQQEKRLPIDWTGGKDHGFVLLAASSRDADRILAYCLQYPIVSAEAPASMLRVPISEVELALDGSPDWIGYRTGPKGDPEERRVWLRAGHPDTPSRLAWEGFRGCVHDRWRELDDREEVLAWLGRSLALDADQAGRLLEVVGYPAPTLAQKEEGTAALHELFE